jgi:hypothetical protein
MSIYLQGGICIFVALHKNGGENFTSILLDSVKNSRYNKPAFNQTKPDPNARKEEF